MFKNRNQRRKRNSYSYAKGLISIFIMTNPPVQSTGTHDKFGVRQTGRRCGPTCDLYKEFQLATSVYFLVFQLSKNNLKSFQKRDNQSELIEDIKRAEDRISFLHNESEYEIIFSSGNISLDIKKSPSDQENCHPAIRPGWLENVLLPKLIKMINNSEQNKTGFPSTLSLIDKASYQGWLRVQQTSKIEMTPRVRRQRVVLYASYSSTCK